MDLFESMMLEHRKLNESGLKSITVEFSDTGTSKAPVKNVTYSVSSPDEAVQEFLKDNPKYNSTAIIQIYDEDGNAWYVDENDNNSIKAIDLADEYDQERFARKGLGNSDLSEDTVKESFVIKSDYYKANPYTQEYSKKSGKKTGYLGYGGRGWVAPENKMIDKFATREEAEAAMKKYVYAKYKPQVVEFESIKEDTAKPLMTDADVHNIADQLYYGFVHQNWSKVDSAEDELREFNVSEEDINELEDIYSRMEYFSLDSANEILGKYMKESTEISEDTVKKSNGKWTNRGDDGKEHGEFDTKKEADAQRKAMFANGYKGESVVKEGTSNVPLKVTVDSHLRVTGKKPEFPDWTLDMVSQLRSQSHKYVQELEISYINMISSGGGIGLYFKTTESFFKSDKSEWEKNRIQEAKSEIQKIRQFIKDFIVDHVDSEIKWSQRSTWYDKLGSELYALGCQTFDEFKYKGESVKKKVTNESIKSSDSEEVLDLLYQALNKLSDMSDDKWSTTPDKDWSALNKVMEDINKAIFRFSKIQTESVKLKEGYGIEITTQDLMNISDRIGELVEMMDDTGLGSIKGDPNTYGIGAPFIGTYNGYIDLSNIEKYVGISDEEEDEYGEW